MLLLWRDYAKVKSAHNIQPLHPQTSIQTMKSLLGRERAAGRQAGRQQNQWCDRWSRRARGSRQRGSWAGAGPAAPRLGPPTPWSPLSKRSRVLAASVGAPPPRVAQADKDHSFLTTRIWGRTATGNHCLCSSHDFLAEGRFPKVMSSL